MNLILKALAPVALFSTLALTTAAQAQAPYHHGPDSRTLNHRQAQQQRRIDQGIRSGRLTPREAGHLEQREARIARQESHARATGGRLSYSERRRIEREESASSRAIYRQKHDRQGYH